jgi:hypothetical protein
MARFHTSSDSNNTLLPAGVYMLQVVDCTETVSKKGSCMFKLKLTTIPHDRHVYDYLVFSPNTFWVISDFCRSSGLELPPEEADIDIYPNHCLLRVCYAELFHELDDGKTRLKVKRYLSRKDAIDINSGLARLNVPVGTPPASKLQKAEVGPVTSQTGPNSSLTPAGISHDTEVEPDDLPF